MGVIVKNKGMAHKMALKEELDASFGEALLAVSKKTKLNQQAGKFDDNNKTKKSMSRAMEMMYQMDAQEMSEKLQEDVC